MLATFNETLGKLWPCPTSMFLGYILCPLTCGLSFCLPNLCIKDAEKSLRVHLDYYNQYRFIESGLEIVLVKKCSTSWLELRIKDDEKTLSDIETRGKQSNSPPKNYFRNPDGSPADKTTPTPMEPSEDNIELMAVNHSFSTPRGGEDSNDETFDDMLKQAVENSQEIDLDEEQDTETAQPQISEDSYYAEDLADVSPRKRSATDSISSPTKSKKRSKRKRSPRKKRTEQ